MFKKLLFITALAVTVVSCQFTETMVLNEDGSGKMSVEVDLGEMMAMASQMGTDSISGDNPLEKRTDTIIAFKDILEEKKDSIATLPPAEQRRLKAMENYKMQMISDPENGEMLVSVFVDFKNVAEANDLMAGLGQADGVMPKPDGSSAGGNTKKEPDFLGVKYSYADGIFKRDGFIKDKQAQQQQLDSMQSMMAFMGEMKYRLKYTFPRRIKSASVQDAMLSMDGKTIEVERKFSDYFKDPDVLDLEVELEN
ncbi:MAG: hypothetical protein AAFP76_03315 [Bacteroidota bacterium]